MIDPVDNCRICHAASAPAGKKRGRRTGREFSLSRCTACGYAWVDQPWTDFAEIYDEAYYAGRGSDPLVDYAFEYEQPRQTIRRAEWRGVRRIIAALDPHAQRWLDFGCGNAALVRDVAATSAIAIAGFDTGAWARRARRDGIAVLTEAELDERSGHFDVVTAIEVIEHVVEPVPFLRQLRNLLRPGGRLFITTGNAAHAPRDFCTWGYVAPEIHVSYFTPQALALALEAAGFKPEFSGYVDGFTHVIRFKILKTMGQRRHRFWHDLIPWPLLSRLADRRYGISALPGGRAV